MVCPYCKEEMDLGVMQSARTIFWSKRKNKIFFIPSKDDITVAKGMNGSYKECYFCSNCNKILMDL